MRLTLAILTVALTVSALPAQNTSIYSRAVPPDRRDLDRVNLALDWTTYLPMAGRTDFISHVQAVDDKQIFVQLASGVLVAVDAATGVQQWHYKYPTPFVSQYPVAVNDQYVFAVNVTRLYCFQRYTGLLEFDYEVEQPNILTGLAGGALPTAGPVCDETNVYLVLNGQSALSYRLPQTLQPVVVPPGAAAAGVLTMPEQVAARAGGASAIAPSAFVAPFEDFRTPSPIYSSQGALPTQKTPSLSALPSVVTPYTLKRRQLRQTPSLTVLPTLQQPYTLRPEFLRYSQRSPSLSVIPPSVARAQELSNIRPKPIGPIAAWPNPYVLPARVQFTPTLTKTNPPLNVSRLWLTTESVTIVAVAAESGAERVVAPLQAALVSPLVGPFAVGANVLGIGCLRDGTVVAIDLQQGLLDQVRIIWSTAVGGSLDHAPIVTNDAVYVSGTGVGSAKLDIKTGNVLWRTEFDADHVLSVNDEHVIVRDRNGVIRIYTQELTRRAPNGLAIASGSIDLHSFAVPIRNPKTDRTFLAANNGILIALRDKSPKYVQAKSLVPPPVIPLAPPAQPGDLPPEQ